MEFIYFLVSIFSSIIGAISGIGGGIIIKPVLDATAVISVSTASFLSGCTVLSMSIVSNIKSRNYDVKLEVKTSTFLAIGAALGGVFGKNIFDQLKESFQNESIVGAVQASLLLLITVGVLIYMKKKDLIKTYHITNVLLCFVVGLLLGILSAFLGIGGGPMNIALLYWMFSMDSKTAAKNSLYIILVSQFTSLLSTFWNKTVPDFQVSVLVLMIVGGIVGGIIGSNLSMKLRTVQVEKVFTILLFIIIGINLYNLVRFIKI